MGNRRDSNQFDTTEAKLTQIEQSLEILRSSYDQYFAGIFKRPPLREHEQLKSLIRSIPPHELKTTASRFKYQSLKTRHLQMSQLWDRTLREIEEGTYKRDLFLLKAKEKTVSSEGKLAAKPSPTHHSGSSTQALEKLYGKLTELTSATQQKLPSRDKFIQQIQDQITAQKTKNPGAKIELKIQKDDRGRYQVKLKVNK